ncbi:MAG: 3-deoxy-8-phosphooctulonate synthase [Phycisphaerales bacterium]|nr:MAG: 3-deoxy-8-phosphooctulonate synthase [Phycisphaerales bacterium]
MPDHTNPPRICTIANTQIGPGQPLAIIAGPCLLESKELGQQVGDHLANLCRKLGLTYIFKASYDKANRSSLHSPRGPGLDTGLRWLTDIATSLAVPFTTDLHEPAQAEPVAQAADLLQIPAFLCRQTNLLLAAGEAAAKHNRAVNVKKGQFLSPAEMVGPVRKLHEAGCDNVLTTERGTFFGYHALVNDFAGLEDLMQLDCHKFSDLGPPPVCFDATHSTQRPGLGEQSGGRRERSAGLARAAVALGVHAVFLEIHPDPDRAMSDAATQLPLEAAEPILTDLARIRDAMRQ